MVKIKTGIVSRSMIQKGYSAALPIALHHAEAAYDDNRTPVKCTTGYVYFNLYIPRRIALSH